MIKSTPFSLICLWLSLLCCLYGSPPIWAQEPCTIDLTELTLDAPPSGSRICLDELITLPDLSFVPEIGATNPAIVWAIYECLPSTSLPLSDGCSIGLNLADTLGNILLGGGIADLRQNALFDDDTAERTIFLVPVIVPNVPSTIPTKTCSGVVVGFNYPTYTVLNPALNEEECGESGCPRPINDDCVAATVIDFTNLEEPIIGTNVCATSSGDPDISGVDCFSFDIDGFSHSVWYQFTGNGGNYTFTLTVDCIDSIELQINDAQMTLYQGTCDALDAHVACNDDTNGLLPALTEVETIPDANYFLLVTGASEDFDEGHFCLVITETTPPPPVCMAHVGTVIPPNSTTSCDGKTIIFSVDGATEGDYATGFLVDDGTGMGFVLSDDGNITLNNTGTSTIDATIRAINFLETDRVAIEMALEDMATLEDIIALINNETICAAVDNTANTIMVLAADDPTCVDCLASFGTVIPPEQTSVCSGEVIPAVTFTVEGDNQNGHTTLFLVDQGDGLLNPSNDLVELPGTGDFTIYAFNYLTEQEAAILDTINNGATIIHLRSLVASNTFCGALQMEGTVITVLSPEDPACFVCMADVGVGDLVTPDVNTSVLCAGVAFMVSVNAAIIENYTNLFILFNNNTSLYNTTGNFTIDAGTYTLNHLHILTENLEAVTTALDNGDTFSDLADLIVVQQLCAAVNPADATLTVLPADAPECGGFVCEAESGIGAFITPNTSTSSLCAGQTITFGIDASGIAGYSHLYILTDGEGEVTYSTTGQFNLEAGNYTLKHISLLMTDLSVLTDALDGGSMFADLAVLIENNNLCASINEASFNFTVLSADDPACSNCQASAGTLTPPIQTLVPAGESSNPPTVAGQFEGQGYTYLFMVTTLDTTNSGRFTILSVNETGSFNFEGLGLAVGKYQIRGLSFQGTLAAFNELGLTTGEALLAAIDDGLCADLILSGYCAEALESLMVNNVDVISHPDGTYTVTFIITGGSGVYVIDSNTIEGSMFVSDTNLICDEMFSFIVGDNAGSMSITVAGDGAECPPDSCNTSAGTLPAEMIFVCAGETAQISAENVNLLDDDILVYTLSNSDGDLMTFNTTGQFALTTISNGQTNEAYTVSVIAGIDGDGDGFPDIDQACTVSTAGGNVVFLTPIQIALTSDCNTQTGVATASITLTGGLPAFDASTNYVVSGHFEGTVNVNDAMVIGQFADGTAINLTATDNETCSQTITPTITCAISCTTDAGTFSQASTLFICDRGAVAVTTANPILGVNDILVYVLRDSSGERIASNTIGQFAFVDIPNAQANQIYTISALAGVDEDGDGLPDPTQECTDETESISVVFLDPIEITLTIGNCNEQTGEVQAELIAIGGLPAFDNTQEYTLTGTLPLTLGFNESVALGGFTGGTIIEFIATDSNNCMATITATIDCEMVNICDTNPITITAETICDPIRGEFNAIVIISGGLPSTNQTATYTVAGSVSLTDIRPNQELTMGPFTDGETVHLIITDDAGCTATYEESVACEKCSNDAGALPNVDQTVFVCATEAATFETQNATVNEGSILVYVVHTESQFDPASILGFNSSGTFTFSDLSTTNQGTVPATNQIYYVSALVGVDQDGDGFPGLNEDACPDNTPNSTPIVFLNPVEIIVDGTCDRPTETFTATFLATGGLPAFDANETYIISGTFNGTISLGQSVNIGPFQNGESYVLNAMDNTGCMGSFFVEDIACTKTPIELLDFDGETLPTANLLHWSTASEINSDFFTLERSSNGVDYEVVATLKAMGSSTSTQFYEWLDKYAPTGISYYRLVETDLGGKETISGIISLTRGKTEFGIYQIAPIPAHHFIELSFAIPYTNFVSLSIYDLTGREIMNKEELATEGSNNLTIEVDHLSPGLYFLTLTTGDQVTIGRFIKN